ncbi:MAG: disulfide reductase, partial [Desulfovibrio sp.]
FGDADLLAPCSACYLNLRRVQEDASTDKELLREINEVLSAEGLSYAASANVRHLLDVLVNDVPAQDITAKVEAEREDLVIAPYTGCQALRPYKVFDDPEQPEALGNVLQALGVTVHDWDMGGRCCGASLMATKKEAALASVAAILDAAGDADAIVTVCPMCQMNLDAYQGQALRRARRDEPLSILYLPQLMGVLMGVSHKELGLGKNLKVTAGFLRKLGQASVPA